MEYFNTHKNKLFILMTRIMNESVDGRKFESDEVEKLIKETMIAKDDFVENVMDYGKNPYQIMDFDYKPIFTKEKIRVNPTILEKRWLKSLVEDDMIKLFLDEDVVSKLDEKLKDVKPLFKMYLEFEKINPKHIKTIVECFRSNSLLKYSSTNKFNKVFKDQVAIPFKLNYSMLDNKFRLSVYSIRDNRLVYINMENIKSTECIRLKNIKDKSLSNNAKLILFKMNSMGRKSFFEQSLKKQERRLTIRVESSKNMGERVHLMFSSYEKKSYMDGNKQYMTIKYYRFDEENIIRHILSLGSCVKVVEPSYIKEKIVKLLKEGQRLNDFSKVKI